MSHVTIYFLTEAKNLEIAKRHVNSCLDSENSFFDGFEIVDSDCGTLKDNLVKLNGMSSEQNYLIKAEQFVREAEEQRKKKYYGLAGDYYRRAGMLYDQRLSDDMPYYNITDWSYEVPTDTNGWYFIPVDFHY
jgi:hypothetical protein